MDSKPFAPSIDWSHEFAQSTWWVLRAFGITAVCVLLVLLLIGKYTTWGRQWWRITGAYFTGRESLPVWLVIAFMLLSTILGVRVSVLLSYYSNDLYSALQIAFQGAASGEQSIRDSGVSGFWTSIIIFCILATFHVARVMLDLFITQRFMLRWRVWLTDRLTMDWLDGFAYYRGRFIGEPIDNPDQRIQLDIDVFTTGTGGNPNTPNNTSGSILLFGAVDSVVSVISFAAILWNLSGPLTLLGVTVPKALFWIVLLYVSIATVIAFWIGHPLIRFAFVNELRNAAFRYALVRLKDAAEAVGFYRGEDAERQQLRGRFAQVVVNYRRWVNRMVGFLGWNLVISQAINPLPFVVQAQRLFAQQISLGDVMQSSSAFGSIHDGLSFFRNVYDQFAEYRASIIRLYGLVDANQRARDLPELALELCPDDSVTLDEVEVRTPDGKQLIKQLDVHLERGDSMVITGPSGSGKTTLLRSLAQMWPYTSGTLRCPIEGNQTMFLSQLPYVPLGDLRAVVSYPCEEGTVADAALQRALVNVALPHLVIRLNEVQDWAKVLSPGEQQRIAFARILLTKPKAVFLDEATSALDEGLELTLYQLVRTELPNTILVSVSHRSTVEQHHRQQLELLGDGEWRLGPVGEKSVPV
jgi:vitamin B12/bleomycin/antimicrobial peptide transport system ATP-binding/permease protein